MTKFPFQGKTQSGEYTDFKPATVYEVYHTVQVWAREGAEALADSLHGRFKASYAPDSHDTLAKGIYVVTLMHRGVPDPRRTLTLARKVIEEAIEEAGVNARYAGWSRTEIGPAEQPRKPWLRDDDGDGDDGDSIFSVPAPRKADFP
jgi:hypothetical protein